jgi:hypothetical protein
MVGAAQPSSWPVGKGRLNNTPPRRIGTQMRNWPGRRPTSGGQAAPCSMASCLSTFVSVSLLLCVSLYFSVRLSVCHFLPRSPPASLSPVSLLFLHLSAPTTFCITMQALLPRQSATWTTRRYDSDGPPDSECSGRTGGPGSLGSSHARAPRRARPGSGIRRSLRAPGETESLAGAFKQSPSETLF